MGKGCETGANGCGRTLKNRLRGALAVCAALGWWGAIYPQLTMVRDTYRIVYEDGAEQEGQQAAEEGMDGGAVYWEILRAERGQIRFRSRLLTELGSWRRKWQEELPLAKENDT